MPRLASFDTHRTAEGPGLRVAWLIAGATLLRLLLAAVAPLTPQEAYYWTWSRALDWSYFDHPPLASYAIALTTAVLGQTAWGIKSAAVLWSLGWNLLWARLVQDMFGDRRLTFWAVLALNLTLLYEVYGVAPTPDGPLLLGWIGTLWAVWRATSRGDARWWWCAGAFMGLAWLGKYSGVLLVPVVGLYLLAVPAQRHWLRRPEPWLALALALLVFSPVLYWNAQHDWASLAFQSGRRVGQMGAFKPRFFALLVATQLLLVTPYLFGLSLLALWHGLRDGLARRLAPHEVLLLFSAGVPLLLFVSVSFVANSKMNWLLPAWWSLIVLGMRLAASRPAALRWRNWGLASSAAVLGGLVIVVSIPNLPLPQDLNIWSGWRGAARAVDRIVAAERAQGHRVFVFSPNYKLSSLVWFYRPSQERTYAQDILGRKALQYDYLAHSEDLVGATGILVVSDQAQSRLDMDASVRPLFERLEHLKTLEVGALGRTARHIEIWRGTGYRGRPAPGQDAVPDEPGP